MPRKRTIAPGFFSNEDLAECTPLARLLFAGLWCWADREGRLEDRPRRLRAEILPYDTTADGEALLGELAKRGFIERYEVGGVRVIQVVAFGEHQDPHPKETASVLPGRDGVVPEVRRRSPKGAPKVDPGPTPEAPGDQTQEPPRQTPEPPKEDTSPACPSRPSSPSRPASPPAEAGGPAGDTRKQPTPLRQRRGCLGPLGTVFVSRCTSGMELGSLTPLSTSEDAGLLEERVRAHGGVDGAVAHVAATFRNRREFKPRSVKLLLDVLGDVLSDEEPPTAAGGA
jgi:hypothetical protein